MDGREKLAHLRDAGWNKLYPHNRVRIAIGLDTCGKSAGAQAIFERVSDYASTHDLPLDVVATGCAGLCFAEPLAQVSIPGMPRAIYGPVDRTWCDEIVAESVCGRYPKRALIGYAYRDWAEGFDTWIPLDSRQETPSDDAAEGLLDIEQFPFLALQTKRITASWGRIAPWSVEEYAALGGYEALRRSIFELEPSDLIERVEAAGLRGRGGAGFPTGKKWNAASASPDNLRFVIANADEGDPGAYMDRGLMESDPHRLLEGMAVAGRAIGSSQGFIFTRSEYPGAIDAVERALAEAHAANVLGGNVLGSAWSFDVSVVRSAGAYVCGEEGALLEALEGKRPDPRKKPPYPTEHGLRGHPTCINNVETLANVPSIVLHGSDRFRECGTELSPGTKVFSLAGTVERAGLVEVPMGMPLRELIVTMAGLASEDLRNVVMNEESACHAGEPNSAKMAVQIGGPSGTLLPLDLPDLTLDFEGLARAGGIMGSGGIVVLGQRACVVDTVRFFLDFSARSSCGRCRACRDGLHEAARLAALVCSGDADANVLASLEALTRDIPRGSRCALGKMAVNPLASALRHFRPTFERHLAGSCPSLVCKELMHFEVVAPHCPGCLCCLPSCPSGAIKGTYGRPFSINQQKCTKCWMCVAQCPYPALMAFPFPAAKPEIVLSKAMAAKAMPKGSHTERDSHHGKAETSNEPSESVPEGCIFCGRCVEACREHGASALSFFGRSRSRKLVKPLFSGHTTCTSCGRCYQACPTGAINHLVPTEMRPI